MSTSDQRVKDLTYTLMIELLAHQFAFPVRWIETQNEILANVGAERIIEVGPANILTNMMKRTHSLLYTEYDLARTFTRRILGPTTDIDDIYMRHTPKNEIEQAESLAPTAQRSPIVSQPSKSPTSSSPSIPLAAVSTSNPDQLAQEEVEDVGLPVTRIVWAIVASKLKKPASSLSSTSTIGSLTGGRSTLTNEIMGDLHQEFKDLLPDRAEDLTLEALCKTLQPGHNGAMGEQTRNMVSKMISAKFPPEYTQAKIRQQVEMQWGLGPMRQDAVLLSGLTSQPPTRMASPTIAKQFLDDLATAYFEQEGLSMPSRDQAKALPAAVDAQMLKALDEKNSKMLRQVVEVLGGHLQELAIGTDKPDGSIDSSIQAVKLLDVWASEHGDEYFEGIMPKFDAKKERIYDSYWNWVSQDIALLVDPATRSSENLKQPGLIGKLILSVANRACDRSLAQIQHLIKQTEMTDVRNKVLLTSLHTSCIMAKDRAPIFLHRIQETSPVTSINDQGKLVYSEHPRITSLLNDVKGIDIYPKSNFPVLCYRQGLPESSPQLTEVFSLDIITARQNGMTFEGKNVLINGAGRRSIGIHVLCSLLSGGARVTLTTSSFSTETTQMYQRLYAEFGSKGSVLRVLPCNLGSHQDILNMVQYLDSDPEWDLDYIVPFAAAPENGRGLEELDAKSELAHRIMLTNLLRLLGAVATAKRKRNVTTRPATVILPLSPNHGLMGSDGLYSESKLALEALLPKWSSESWSEYLSLMGVLIGWTRGTGLMEENDLVAQAVEDMGVRTLSAEEMASNIAILMGGSLNAQCQSHPLLVDMGGGMGNIKSLKDKLGGIRNYLNTTAEIQRAVENERRLEIACVTGQQAHPFAAEGLSHRLACKANLKLPLPALPNYETEVRHLAENLEGMVDLSRVVVITGFAELGPHGNSRTRWEMELDGEYSLEGCIEMAQLMGLIKYRSGMTKDGRSFSSWVDAEDLQPVEDQDIPKRYMPTISQHSGIRSIEPDHCDNRYDPEKKDGLQEILLQRDLPPFEVSPNVAEDLCRKHGDKVAVTWDESGTCWAKLKAGAAIMVPRASRFDRTVAGQIPTGWSPKNYGISDDIIEQVDPVTLFTLVCTVEALLTSGITDPYELYQHIHVSEVGICIGSSMGGLSSLRKMHRDRYVDKPVKGDILQETFINTTGAWINMLLTSSSGPIRTPVGACATALESLDTGYDLIVAKKAKVCLVGGVEDFVEDVSYEFGSMRATANTDDEFAAGRSPQEMSRPTATSRSGFIESQGCGVQVLTSAELALEMGLPIYGVVSYTSMSADKASRSVPAPGKGVLTNAREVRSNKLAPPPLISLAARRRLLELRKRQIKSWSESSIEDIKSEPQDLALFATAEEAEVNRQEAIAAIQEEAANQIVEATFNLGNNFWRDSTKQEISPVRGSLATWGLGIDDIAVASLHGTSTKQNDLNETLVIEEQLRHLGRQDGNLVLCVCQKWLTGHSKGAAGAWMVNGCLQMMDSALVPGNRNADNIDEGLRSRSHLLFPNTSVGTKGIKACSVTSFGFGQKGSQALLVHPRYLFAAISEERFKTYVPKRQSRWRKATSAFSKSIINEDLVSRVIKSSPPYEIEKEKETLLNPAARF